MKITDIVKFLPAALEHKMPTLLVGSPGIAKSDIIKHVAVDLLKYDFMVEQLCTHDVIDAKGLPAIYNREDGTKGADFIEYGNLRKLIDAKSPLVVLIDDLRHASQSVMASWLHIILNREINGKKISEHVRFVAATNDSNHSAGGSSIITPLLSRFATIIHVEPDVDSWKKWAIKAGMPIELVAFMNYRPQFLLNKELKLENNKEVWVDKQLPKTTTNFACPRTIASVGKWINLGITDLEVLKGAAGESFAAEFLAFYRVYKTLATLPDKAILNPLTCEIPTKMSEKYALAGALSHKATEMNFDNILQYMDRVSTELTVFLIKDAGTRDSKVLETNAFINWSIANPDALK